METVYDLTIRRGSRKFTTTVQGYSRLATLRRVWFNIEADIKTGAMRDDVRGIRPVLVLLLILLALPAAAVNSPRPSSFSAQNGVLTIRWSNLNTNHPWLLSYADAPGAWRWETNRLSSTDGALAVSRPMTEPVRFYRLWPAAP